MGRQREIIAEARDRLGGRTKFAATIGAGYTTVQGWESAEGVMEGPSLARLALMFPHYADELIALQAAQKGFAVKDLPVFLSDAQTFVALEARSAAESGDFKASAAERDVLNRVAHGGIPLTQEQHQVAAEVVERFARSSTARRAAAAAGSDSAEEGLRKLREVAGKGADQAARPTRPGRRGAGGPGR